MEVSSAPASASGRRHQSPPRRAWLLRALAALAAGLVLAACGGSGSSDAPAGSGDSGAVASPLQCESIATAVTAAPPLSRVALSGLAGASSDTAWVRVSAAGGTPYPTALYLGETGDAEVMVPLHPAGPAGGTLSLTVTDGDADCPTMTFQVEPLPAATGDPARELEAALDAVAAALAGRYGTAAATLDATALDQLSPELAALALTFESLQAVDLDAELAGLSPTEQANLQGLLARLDLAPLLQALATEIEALPDAAPAAASAITNAGMPPAAGTTMLQRALAPARSLRQGVAPLTTPADCVDPAAIGIPARSS